MGVLGSIFFIGHMSLLLVNVLIVHDVASWDGLDA